MSGFVNGDSGSKPQAVIALSPGLCRVIAMVTATPAFAASTVPGARSSSAASVSGTRRSAASPGPSGSNVQFGCRASSIHDPAVAAFSWMLTVSGPTGSRTVKSGSGNLARYGTWRMNGIKYPNSTEQSAGWYLHVHVHRHGVGK